MTEKEQWVDKLVKAGCCLDVADEVVEQMLINATLTRKDRAASGDYTQQFEDFWKRYPRTPVMSKKEAWAQWKRLSPEDRLKATGAVPKYVDWLAGQRDCPVVHACRFLSQRRFDGFGEMPRFKPDPKSAAGHAEAAIMAGKFYARAGSPQLRAWDAYYKATRGRGCTRDKIGGWMVDSEWPPKVNA